MMKLRRTAMLYQVHDYNHSSTIVMLYFLHPLPAFHVDHREQLFMDGLTSFFNQSFGTTAPTATTTAAPAAAAHPNKVAVDAQPVLPPNVASAKKAKKSKLVAEVATEAALIVQASPVVKQREEARSLVKSAKKRAH